MHGDFKISKSQLLVTASLGVILGIGVGLLLMPPLKILFITLACLISALVMSWLNKKLKLIVPIILFISFICGTLRVQNSEALNDLSDWYKDPQDFHALLVADPVMKSSSQQLVIAPQNKTARLLITTSPYTKFSYGDLLWVRGKVSAVKTSGSFNYQKFLAKDNIYGQMQYPKTIVLKSSQGSPLPAVILKIKSLIIARINQTVKQPESGLVIGILLGIKEGITKPIIDAFAATGMSHIVAVSGFNITIMIAALEKCSPLIGRKLSFWFALLSIIFFVVLTGASSSVIRAGIMGSLVLLASRSGRLPSITPILCLTAALMILQNPLILFWDVGFQLSFLATIGIVYGVPLFEQVGESGPWSMIKQALLVTVAANLITAPLLLYQFGKISIIAPLTNLLVLPLVPPAMLFGSLTLIPFIGFGAGFIAQGITWVMIGIARLGSLIPHAQLSGSITIWQMVLMWLMLTLLYLAILNHKLKKPHK